MVQQTLRDSELRYRRLFETAQDGILILDAETGMITDVNPFLVNMLGYSREEFVKKKLWEVGAFKDIEASKDAFEALKEKEYIRYEDLPLRAKSGILIQVEFVSNVYWAGSGKVIQCNIRDDTEHKRIVTALQENEKKYHDLVNQSLDGVFVIEFSGKILTVNQALCKELGFSEEEFLSMNIWDIIPEQYLDQYRERLAKILKGESLKETAEYSVPGKDGKLHYLEVLSTPHYSGKNIIGFQGVARDITARRRVEQALLESEGNFRRVVEHLPSVVYMNPVGDASSTHYVSPQIETLLGYTPQEWLADPKLWSKTLYPEDQPRVLAQVAAINQSHEPFNMEYRMIARGNRQVWIHDQAILVKDPKGQPQFWQGIMLDITERKNAEQAIRLSEKKFKTLFEIAPVGISVLDQDQKIADVNYALQRIIRMHKDELLEEAYLGRTYLRPDGTVMPREELASARAFKEGMPIFDIETGIVTETGDVIWTQVSAAPLDTPDTSLVVITQDITERKQADERIQRQVEHLIALSAIDRVIAGNFDMGLSLSEILIYVTKELGMDAADILIFNSNSQILEYGAGRGFRTAAIRKSQVRLGESYAGRAALERQTVHIPDLRAEPDNLFLTTLLKGEDFVCYYGVPLIVKGKVRGVLEVFHRAALEPDSEWLDFLNTLAGQTAIAIDSAVLFESLQRSNLELNQAYDATIEGWSKAMDLRDKETEGHTQRVTKVTLELARAFGLSEEELVQVRWGSLLHDIGKMGVPDGILLKPGALTHEEWILMKKHSTFAYEMLSPIRYLRLALDIPYCHHEKWDGTGYPRGLKGDQIPLVARIFAVVDVWDALSSDRPYRDAWTEEKVREHILLLSGTHFDPRVVDVFMRFLDKTLEEL